MHRRSFIFLFFMLPLVLLAESIIGGSGEVKVEHFSTIGQDERGNIVWMLEGRFAQVQGNMTTLQEFLLKYMPGDKKQGTADRRNYVMRSPICRYYQILNEVKSNSAITVISNGLRASGIGYDIYLDKHIVRVRSTVKIVIEKRKSIDFKRKIGNE